MIISLRNVRHRSHIKYALSVQRQGTGSISVRANSRNVLTVDKTTELWHINAQKERR